MVNNSKKCYKCHIKIHQDSIDNDYDESLYYLFCKKCIKQISVCSRSKCKKIFLLSDEEMKNLKLLYLPNSSYQFYIYSDIYDLVINKYGSLENLQTIIDSKLKLKRNKIEKKKENKLQREEKLKYIFMINKLEYKNYGDCYAYIHYGKPDIETIIQNELKKNNDMHCRRIELANELKKHNLVLDETLKSCYEYIHGLNTKDIRDIIKCIKIEHSIKHNKNNKDVQIFLSL